MNRIAGLRAALSMVVLALLLAPRADAQPLSRRPYSLHEIRLGTPISALRKLEFIDEEEREGLGQSLALICSNEPGALRLERLRLTSIDRPGAVRCAVFTTPPDGDPLPFGLDILGERVQPIFVLYRREADRELRLAQILTSLQNDRFQSVVALLQRSYGDPSNYDMSSVGTLFGTQMLNATYHWTNGVSTIRADMLSIELNKMTLVFTHDEIMRDVDRIGSRLIMPK